MNDVSLIGRLAREPELITTDSGTAIAKLRLAVDRRRRDDGAVFVDVKCFEAEPAPVPSTSPRAARSQSAAGWSSTSGRPTGAPSARGCM
jgi:Single-strand binding protein family